jgi:hypothetical protein
MPECIHGLEEERCDLCTQRGRVSRGVDGTMAGKSFALVFVPTLRSDTFVHLNREGDHWKFRWYESPSRPATELAQSGKASTRLVLDLDDVEFEHEMSYPYSTSPGGVSITDSRYWFDEIARVNAKYEIG